MKKVFLISIICIIVFAICIVAIIPACNSLTLNSPENVADVFHAHEELFQTAAEVITSYDTGESIHITPREGDTSPGHAIRKMGNLYYETLDALDENVYLALYEAFDPLYEALKESGDFYGLVMYDSRVQFILDGPVYGSTAELYYFVDADFGSYYMGQVEKSMQINEHWYVEMGSY